MELRKSDALIVVDVQNDFFPGGALAVKYAHAVIPKINVLVRKFDNVYITRDWHPPDHDSFVENPEFKDTSWPVHCVQNSPGAEFHGDIYVPLDAIIVSKGEKEDKPGYSGFEDTGLADDLRSKDINRVFICGLATDYCVKHTAIAAAEEGFDVKVIEDACRGVDVPEGNVDEAKNEMKGAGADFITTKDVADPT